MIMDKTKLIKMLTEEQQNLAVAELFQSQIYLTTVNCRCFECKHVWDFDCTIDNDPELNAIECPECNETQNIIWYKQHYKV